MHRYFNLLIVLPLFTGAGLCAPKPRVVSLGKPSAIKWCVGPNEGKCSRFEGSRSVRGWSGKGIYPGDVPRHHRAAVRCAPRLPRERRLARRNHLASQLGLAAPRRAAGGPDDRPISAVNLPEFDSYYSVASWYRDYAAYCGVSDDGKKLFAVVFQVGRRKPVLKKALGATAEDEMPDSECPAPVWERHPARVSFEADENEKSTYTVRGHAADLMSDDDGEEEKAAK